MKNRQDSSRLGRPFITRGGVLVNKDITIDQDALMLGIGIIDLPANCVVVISEGMAKVRNLPENGEYRIVTNQGKDRRMRR